MAQTFYLSSLGCAKNQVDSEMMLGLLASLGYKRTLTPEEAEIIIVNTCGFIADAKEESINTICAMIPLKEAGSCRLLVVTGCLAEKYREDLAAELPEVDGFLGTHEYHKIGALLNRLEGKPEPPVAGDVASLYAHRSLLTPGHTAYMKIAEGCNNRCAYCLIPQLRGPLASVPVETLLAEAKVLREQGVAELILIAQDTSNYGRDLYDKEMLPQLLEQVAALGFTWVRLLYCYPTRISEELLTVMANHKNICRYLDIPLQHVSDSILAAMGREGRKRDILDAFRRIRQALPDIAIRTTLMVGFPGETEEDFEELLDFVEEADLLWAGVFAYSQEDDTPAATMPNQIPQEVKEQRKNRLLARLATLSAKHMERFVGQTMLAVVEEQLGPDLWMARSQYQAPEVDGFITLQAEGLEVGQFVEVEITASDYYDLTGVLVSQEK